MCSFANRGAERIEKFEDLGKLENLLTKCLAEVQPSSYAINWGLSVDFATMFYFSLNFMNEIYDAWFEVGIIAFTKNFPEKGMLCLKAF